VAVRQAALVSDESALEACLQRCAMQINDLYLLPLYVRLFKASPCSILRLNIALLTGPVSNGKEVKVLWTPRQGSDGEFLHFVIRELPQRQQSAFAITIFIGHVLIVAEVYTTTRLLQL